jgi:hypothetical protein
MIISEYTKILEDILIRIEQLESSKKNSLTAVLQALIREFRYNANTAEYLSSNYKDYGDTYKSLIRVCLEITTYILYIVDSNCENRALAFKYFIYNRKLSIALKELELCKNNQTRIKMKLMILITELLKFKIE